MNKLKKASFYIFGILYIFAGCLHFYMPDFYIKIMPPYLPWHLALVYISGVIEVLLGIGLLFKVTRKLSAWGIIALLIAVFPANIYLAFNDLPQEQLNTTPLIALWIRFPIQVLLIAIAYVQSRVTD